MEAADQHARSMMAVATWECFGGEHNWQRNVRVGHKWCRVETSRTCCQRPRHGQQHPFDGQQHPQNSCPRPLEWNEGNWSVNQLLEQGPRSVDAVAADQRFSWRIFEIHCLFRNVFWMKQWSQWKCQICKVVNIGFWLC